MSNSKILVLMAAAALAPMIVNAQPRSAQHIDAPSHFAANEAGVKKHPELAPAGKSSSEVAAELKTAQTDPKQAGLLRWGFVVQPPKVGPAKSRAEVVAELENAQKQSGWDSASRLGQHR